METTIPPPPSLIATLPFTAATDIGETPPASLTPLISSNPTLKIYTPQSPHFLPLLATWTLSHPSTPLCIIRATNPSEISTILSFCRQASLPLTIRSGGHDLWGRSSIDAGVIIDIREMNEMVLGEGEEEGTVRIGGGVQTGPLVDFLDERGLVTACTLAGNVGHVGWAFGGGFGPLVNSYGLGVDQIVSAKIITADGKLQTADAELLWGIKGAGGAFGLITEVVLKVYPLKKMLGGMLMFAIPEAQKVIAGWQEMVKKEKVPATLTTGFHFSKRMGGAAMMMLFSWASEDFETGRMWLEKIKGLGNVMMDMVGETTIKKWSDQMAPMLPKASYNMSRALFISSYTPEAIAVLASAAEKIPDGEQFGVGSFLIFGDPVKPRPDSSFASREPFVFLHALGPVADESRIGESREWTDGVFHGLQKAGVFRSNYLSILARDMPVEDCFGKEIFERLKVLKKKVDPDNVFRSVPATF